MKSQNFIFLATLGICTYEEAKHPFEKLEHIPHTHHSILAPHTVNVYNISGLHVITVNGAILASSIQNSR